MVRPLTKRTKDGTRYVRPLAVEAEIEGVLREDPTALRRRLLVRDKASPQYLQSECLIYLFRDALRAEDEKCYNVILPILLDRCEKTLNWKILSSLPNADQLREDVLSEFSVLLAGDRTGKQPDELDFYECRFNSAFEALRVDVLNRELKRLKHIVELPSDHDEPELYAAEDVFARVSETWQTPATQESGHWELYEAIRALPSDERRAVVLCHVYGYKVESKDPDQVTAAKLCNCTGRTIRNRLSHAAKKLAQFRREPCARR